MSKYMYAEFRYTKETLAYIRKQILERKQLQRDTRVLEYIY